MINIDYQGNERCSGYIRGVTSIHCPECKTTGLIKDQTRALIGWDMRGKRPVLWRKRRERFVAEIPHPPHPMSREVHL
jgi:LSD1 subclass zinc finger protein